MSICLTKMSEIKIGAALDYYYTASETCVPNGPNFDYTYYLTVTGIVGLISSLLSLTLYQSFFGSWRFRPAISLTLVISALALIFDLIIINRWNTYLGIPGRFLSTLLMQSLWLAQFKYPQLQSYTSLFSSVVR